MIKNVTYKEPENYFTPEMLATAEEWEHQNGNQTITKENQAKTKSKPNHNQDITKKGFNDNGKKRI